MSVKSAKRDDEMRYIVTSVTHKIDMYADSGEVDYLHKAIAVLYAEIKKANGDDDNKTLVVDGNCKKCQTKIPLEAKYCYKCGRKIIKESEEQK